jgi:hypothetical protein
VKLVDGAPDDVKYAGRAAKAEERTLNHEAHVLRVLVLIALLMAHFEVDGRQP